MLVLGIFSFEWDNGNITKVKKRIPIEDVELFFNQVLGVKEDKKNSNNEKRFIAVGYSPNGKPMFVCFTIRGTKEYPKIRVISCRFMHRREADEYEIFKKDYEKENQE